MPLSWSFVAFMRAWSGYHFSLADRVGVVPVAGVVVEGGVVRLVWEPFGSHEPGPD